MESKKQEPVGRFLRELLNEHYFLTLCHCTPDLSFQGRQSAWPGLVYTALLGQDETELIISLKGHAIKQKKFPENH